MTPMALLKYGGRCVVVLLALAAIFVGWLSLHESPEGRLFATIIPVVQGHLPQTLTPWTVSALTPMVPATMTPMKRPAGEVMRTLAGTGDQMPANGLGMCCRASAYDYESVYRSVLWFFLQGGRHVDGAFLYLNAKPIGAAIQAAIARGVPRKEMFITTKINDRTISSGAERITSVLERELADFQIDYFDLVLLHSPTPFIPIGQPPEEAWAELRQDAWRTLSAAKKKGLVRNIGVSNFDINHLEEIVAIEAETSPIATNQFMLNPFSPSYAFKIAEWCQAHNIVVTAHSSLGGLMKHQVEAAGAAIKAIAAKHDSLKTTTQVLLKWALQRGFVVIPGSGNPAHQASNLAIYEAQLSDSEMASLETLKDAEGMMYMDTRDAAIKAKDEI